MTMHKTVLSLRIISKIIGGLHGSNEWQYRWRIIYSNASDNLESIGHVDAFNDPLIDKDSKLRYRADVLIEDYIAKIETKINKEIAKAKKKIWWCLWWRWA